ncbi:branched-chain amino acid ABC transporter permease [Pseudoprimorskyibacter insulae]|uniref:High-affinity branched-chain amino acid transport system permease protein LivH n=1 Tax=Pseudoprimorskyibacter insulae TaxID=1695997 RepID=A0A2R8AZS7_9RHOB|nr:branched-chain amino acid ABC transporter permease [Pseudoprimorskyibacter insulae]SPF81528.1 hypothetical protein PRI8871_03352 [Pseudoprimorskyibacter insulae]
MHKILTSQSKRPLVWLAVITVASVLPLAMNDPYWRYLLVLTLIFGTLAISLDIIIGDMGQFSFGHQALFGMSAYVTAILSVKLDMPVGPSMVFGILFSTLLGFIVALIALKRARGLYLAIITLGVGQVIQVVMTSWYELSGGISGIPMVPPVSYYSSTNGWVPLYSELGSYYVALAILCLSAYVVHAWRRSRNGRAVAAIRDNEQQSSALGINPYWHYVAAFTLASALAGVAGVIFAHFSGQVGPQSLGLYYMFWLLVMVVVGGSRSLIGPVVGAWIFVFVPEFLSFAQEWRTIIFGALLLVTILVLPKGIIPSLQDSLTSWMRSKGKDAGALTPNSLTTKTK